jgi:hypothetical protein
MGVKLYITQSIAIGVILCKNIFIKFNLHNTIPVAIIENFW